MPEIVLLFLPMGADDLPIVLWCCSVLIETKRIPSLRLKIVPLGYLQLGSERL